MKKLTFLLLLLFAACCLAQDPPWNDKGDLALLTKPDGMYKFGPPAPWVVAESFKDRFGLLPELVVFSDLDEYFGVRSTFIYFYKPYLDWQALPEDSVWWQEDFTWGLLRPHLRAVLENIETSSQQILPLPNYDLDRNIAYLDTGTYEATFTTDIINIPLTQDTAAYRLWVEPVTTPLPKYIEIDTLYIVKTPRLVPEDTLLWMNINWVSSITADPELPARMLEYFPDDTRILRHQFWLYYNAVNCDSVTYYGNRLIAVWESGTSGFLGDMIRNFNQKQAIEDVQQRIQDICVDGVAKEKKALGMSEL